MPCVGGAIRGDHGFVAFADAEQLILAHDVLAAILHVVLVQSRFHDGVDRTGFFAESAVDALEEIDVVARGASRPVGAHIRFDGYGGRRNHPFPTLAANPSLLALPYPAPA